MKYTINLARTKKDVSELLDVVKATWIATYTNESRGLTSSMIEEFLNKKYSSEYKSMRYKCLRDSKHRNWVAKDQEANIIGWIGCEINDNNIGGFGVYVLPEFQGRGTGRIFIDHAVKWMKNAKVKEIRINVLDYNTKTIEFYKHYGFEFTGHKDDFVLGNFVGKEWSLEMRQK